MTTTTRTRMNAQILKHGENLNAIFNTGIEPNKLYSKLLSLERRASKIVLDYCNGDNNVNTDTIEEKITPIMDAVYKLLNNGKYNDDRPHQKKVPVFCNYDARGYALKINDQYVRAYNLDIYKDWGGYGILAPTFDGNN